MTWEWINIQQMLIFDWIIPLTLIWFYWKYSFPVKFRNPSLIFCLWAHVVWLNLRYKLLSHKYLTPAWQCYQIIINPSGMYEIIVHQSVKMRTLAVPSVNKSLWPLHMWNRAFCALNRITRGKRKRSCWQSALCCTLCFGCIKTAQPFCYSHESYCNFLCIESSSSLSLYSSVNSQKLRGKRQSLCLWVHTIALFRSVIYCYKLNNSVLLGSVQ